MRCRAIAVTVAGALLCAPAAVQADRPATVPALERWTDASGGGTFALRRDARVVVRRRDRRALLGEARVLAADLGALRGRRVRVVTTRAPRAGDVLVGRTRDPSLGDEGYRLRVGSRFDVLAYRGAGAYYGGRTLLQLVRGGEPIPRGRALDRPLYPERALMVDNGRVFFSRPWLERRIAELGSLKLNMLHLHISDNQGFRIRSDSHPEAVTEPALSKADIRRLVAVARRHHVTLVPEIDAPGHMEAALREHPELQLVSVTGARQVDKLDVTNEAARRFVFDLVDELAPLFPGPYWHTGADEYLGPFSTEADYNRYPQLEAYADSRYGAEANGKDAVIDFVNAVGDRARANGKTLRVWSDGVGGGSAVRTDPRATVMWWEEEHSPTPEELVAAGHRVLNAGWWPNYYVTGGPLKDLRTPVEQAYEGWEPWQFSGLYTPKWGAGPAAPPSGELPRGDPRQLGTSLQVWNDDPESPGAREDAVAAGIAPRLRVLAQKGWGSPLLATSYAEFEARTARASGSFP